MQSRFAKLTMTNTDFIATDLHGHSFLSDGLLSPDHYVRVRAAERLQVIALSDHDILAGVRGAATLAHQLGMTLIPAMETTSFIHFGTPEAEQIHVLAYFPPSMLAPGRLEKTKLYQRGERLVASWRSFVLAWVDSLSPADREIADPRGELLKLSAAEFPGLGVLINKLVGEPRRAGETVEQAKHRVASRAHVVSAFHHHHVLFWNSQPKLFAWSPEEMIETIRADGAIDVVAHPNRIRDTARMDKVLTYAQGVEVYTSRHSEVIAARFLEYATRNNKLWTASTDDHQQVRQVPYRPPPSGTPRATVEKLLAGPSRS